MSRALLTVTLMALALGCADAPSAPPPVDATVNDVTADATLDGSGEASAMDAPTADVVDENRIVVPSDVPAVGDPLAWDVRRRGPFHTGYRLLSLTYTPRGSTTPRTLPVHVWYPTHAIAGPHPVYGRFFRDPEAVTDAPIAPPAHPMGYPLQVYSHGDHGFGGTTHVLMRYFASHGWVTVAPDHIGNTLFDTPTPRPFNINHLRPQDVRAALEFVASLPASDPLAGRCVVSRTLLTGHSYGTHTVWSGVGATYDVDAVARRCTMDSTCTADDRAVMRGSLGDPRFVAGIPMAGSISRDLFGADGHRSVMVPILAMSGTADPVGAETQFMTTAPVDLTWIDIQGACHQFFALGGCEAIPDSFQDTIMGAWAMAFARRHVLGDNDATVRAILDGTMSLSDRVSFHRRTP